jgi:hypothetical protein
MRALALLSALLLAGCGSACRLVDVSAETSPAVVPRGEHRVPAGVRCIATLERAVGRETANARRRRELFAERHARRLAALVRQTELFDETNQPPTFTFSLEERLESEPVWEGRCKNYLGSMFIGVGLPFIPLLIYRSHEFRPHEPAVALELRLKVADHRGHELSHLTTKSLILIEEQEEGCEEPNPLLDSPHPSAIDLAFERGARVLVARLAADEDLQRRLGAAAERARLVVCRRCEVLAGRDDARHCARCGGALR